MPAYFPNMRSHLLPKDSQYIYLSEKKDYRKQAMLLASEYYIFESFAFIDALVEMISVFNEASEPYPFTFRAKRGKDTQLHSVNAVEIKDLQGLKVYFWRTFIASDSSYPLNINSDLRNPADQPVLDSQVQVNSLSVGRPALINCVSDYSRPLMTAKNYDEVKKFLRNALYDIHSMLVFCRDFWGKLSQRYKACSDTRRCDVFLDDNRLYMPKNPALPKEIKNLVRQYTGIAPTFFSQISKRKQKLDEETEKTELSLTSEEWDKVDFSPTAEEADKVDFSLTAEEVEEVEFSLTTEQAEEIELSQTEKEAEKAERSKTHDCCKCVIL